MKFGHVMFLFLHLRLVPSSLVVKNTNEAELYEHKIIMPYQKEQLSFTRSDDPKLGLVIDVKSIPRTQMFGENRQRKNRRGDKRRRRKDKHGKMGRHKNKVNKTLDVDAKQNLRNHEKDALVRNRTIEILRNGVRILSTDETQGHVGNKSNIDMIRVNETLLEKILSSAVSKPDLLISASGIYKLPIGGDIYGSKKLSKSDIAEESYLRNSNVSEETGTTEMYEDRKNQRNKTDETKDYDYEYSGMEDFQDKIPDDFANGNKTFANDYESVNLDDNIGTTLEQIVAILQNLTNDGKNCSGVLTNCTDEDTNWVFGWGGDDPCRKWLDCKENLELAFSGEHHSLPSCPCHYPSTIFYDDKIWDEKQMKYFRWKDASSESERLDVYKPGAAYCIRSLLAQGSSTISSQHCCYDRELRLLTRGSGAGTVNFVSPDVSERLHDTVDMLPWRLCKGDFTRYNQARKPDNSNSCTVNPDNEQYQLQVEVSKYF